MPPHDLAIGSGSPAEDLTTLDNSETPSSLHQMLSEAIPRAAGPRHKHAALRAETPCAVLAFFF